MDSDKMWTLSAIKEVIDSRDPKQTSVYQTYSFLCQTQTNGTNIQDVSRSKEKQECNLKAEELQLFIVELLEQIIIAKTIDRDEPIKFLLALKDLNSEVLNKIVCESLWIVVFDWKTIKVGNDCKELYQKVLQKLMDQGIVTLEMIQDQIEEDILMDCGVLSKDSYRNNRNRIKTNMIYELK